MNVDAHPLVVEARGRLRDAISAVCRAEERHRVMLAAASPLPGRMAPLDVAVQNALISAYLDHAEAERRLHGLMAALSVPGGVVVKDYEVVGEGCGDVGA